MDYIITLKLGYLAGKLKLSKNKTLEKLSDEIIDIFFNYNNNDNNLNRLDKVLDEILKFENSILQK